MRILTCLFFSCVLTASASAQSATPPGLVSNQERKFTYVFVHGAWAGGWEWKKCAEALKAAGHTVHRPTLTGQGERVHLAHADIDLSMHIQDIVNFIVWEDLRDIVLVGHSYGGMVITGVIDQVPERIKHAIYLDAIVPEDGESAFTAIAPDRPPLAAVDGFYLLGAMKESPIPHVVPMPEKTFSQPIALKNQAIARKVPTTYILTADDAKMPERDGFYRGYERAKARQWKTAVMEGDHIVHLTKTQELARLLEQTP